MQPKLCQNFFYQTKHLNFFTCVWPKKNLPDKKISNNRPLPISKQNNQFHRPLPYLRLDPRANFNHTRRGSLTMVAWERRGDRSRGTLRVGITSTSSPPKLHWRVATDEMSGAPLDPRSPKANSSFVLALLSLRVGPISYTRTLPVIWWPETPNGPAVFRLYGLDKNAAHLVSSSSHLLFLDSLDQ